MYVFFGSSESATFLLINRVIPMFFDLSVFCRFVTNQIQRNEKTFYVL